jgi:hypothetical protein
MGADGGRKLPVKLRMVGAHKPSNRGLNFLHPSAAIPASLQMSVNLSRALRRKLAVRRTNEFFVRDVIHR